MRMPHDHGLSALMFMARWLCSWLYRIRPAAMHERMVPVAHTTLTSSFDKLAADPNQVCNTPKQLWKLVNSSPLRFGLQMRWFPQPLPKPVGESKAAAEKTEDVDELDWVDGLATMAGAGDPTVKSGIAVHMYTCNKSMVDTALFNSDGDFLIVPQEGTLHIQTEMGFLDVEPKEIVVIQRGIRFRVGVDGPSRGYVLEIFGGHFQLPDLGPIGSNGLANARDFLYPVASYEDRDVDYVILNKYGGHLWSSISHHSPFDVVAWHGNYAPYKYDLSKFNTMNSVSYDHPDPSIYTVLTAPTDTPGVALCDFVIFPPRWMVMDRSFRPPYYHRNLMSEFMGMVWGKYDAKVGFSQEVPRCIPA
jgi:homogentisate 1,2-dioxygenase